MLLIDEMDQGVDKFLEHLARSLLALAGELDEHDANLDFGQLLEDVEVQIVIAVRRVVRVLQVAELRVDLLEDLDDLPGIPRRLRSVEVEELDAREGRVKADLKQ